MPPVDKTWLGSTGDFNTAGNWSPSGVPVATDSLFFNKTSGSNDIDGYNASGIALAGTTVTEDYTGSMGADGDPLRLDITSLTYNGRGVAAYITVEAGSARDTDVIVMGTGSGANGLHLATAASATIENPKYMGGRITIANGTAHKAGAVVICGSIDPSIKLTLVIGTGVTNISELRTLGGTVTCKSAVTTITHEDGTLKHTLGAVTTANVYGGTLKPEGVGTFGAINIYTNATVDGSGSSDARIWTAVNIFGKSVLNYANGLGNITITTRTMNTSKATVVISDYGTQY